MTLEQTLDAHPELLSATFPANAAPNFLHRVRGNRSSRERVGACASRPRRTWRRSARRWRGAFEHDPLWGWAFEDAERERKLAALAAVFGFFAAAALDLGWVRVTDGVEAVALWIPPGLAGDVARRRGAAAGRDRRRLRAGVGGAGAASCSTPSKRNHPHEPPHFYLSLLGTHPDHAGHGHGLGLVADCLAEIDAGDPPAAAFLESSNPANVPRYERLGFRPTREVELIAGLGGTQMWRGPGGSAAGRARPLRPGPSSSTPREAAEVRQLLFELEHRGEEVAVLLDPVEHRVGLEDQLLAVARVGGRGSTSSQVTGVEAVGCSRARRL